MRVKGVTAATVDVKAGRAEITYDPERTDPEAIAAAITAAGFPAKIAGGRDQG